MNSIKRNNNGDGMAPGTVLLLLVFGMSLAIIGGFGIWGVFTVWGAK